MCNPCFYPFVAEFSALFKVMFAADLFDNLLPYRVNDRFYAVIVLSLKHVICFALVTVSVF